MQFHLNYKPEKSSEEIHHQQKILMTGSCFAENIGEFLSHRKFNCLINPSGILFNPISIAESLGSLMENSELQPELLVQSDETFYSLLHHGDFRSESREGLLDLVHSVTEKSHQFLKKADWLIISFGSAYVYRHLETNRIAANCHKLPQNHFKKERLKTNDVVGAYSQLIKKLSAWNPQLKLIFTVSPVKYLRDGLVENNLSKSVLIQSVHEIVGSHSNCFYFPAYELVTDDLRDYRFYKEDMAHPNNAAIQYVWKRFSQAYFSEQTQVLNKRLEEILQAAEHRPVNAISNAHVKFQNTFFEMCVQLEKEFSFLDLSREKNKFKKP